MRKIALIVSLLALSQLTGCVAHRYYSDTPSRNYNGYQQEYPAPYPNQDQSTYRQVPQVQQQEGYRTDQLANDQQAQANWAQIIDIRRTREVTQSHGGGAVIGAIIGGIIGHQLGGNDGHGSSRRYGHGYGRSRYYGGHHSDDGRGAATLGGALVGGVIGNELDRGSTELRVRTEITLRSTSGQTHNVQAGDQGGWRVGDWVRVGFQAGRWVIY